MVHSCTMAIHTTCISGLYTRKDNVNFCLLNSMCMVAVYSKIYTYSRMYVKRSMELNMEHI